MKRKSVTHSFRFIGGLLLATIVSSCMKNSMNVNGPLPSSAPVSMSVVFSKSGGAGLFKTSGVQAGDSLRIDSAVVILARIKFESNIDSVAVDSTENAPDDLDRDQSIVFRGPFVIHVQDTVAINFANQVLPAGTYNGIRFKIHRLQDGEQHEDSDDRGNRGSHNDSSVVGSSITVWGAIERNGVWTSFTFHFDEEIEFKIKGTFTVASSTSSVRIALNFNMSSWFTDVQTGALLDPTDHSEANLERIKRAIFASFGQGLGGRDRGDGHPEDDGGGNDGGRGHSGDGNDGGGHDGGNHGGGHDGGNGDGGDGH